MRIAFLALCALRFIHERNIKNDTLVQVKALRFTIASVYSSLLVWKNIAWSDIKVCWLNIKVFRS
jgi:hypothetical protein